MKITKKVKLHIVTALITDAQGNVIANPSQPFTRESLAEKAQDVLKSFGIDSTVEEEVKTVEMSVA